MDMESNQDLSKARSVSNY